MLKMPDLTVAELTLIFWKKQINCNSHVIYKLKNGVNFKQIESNIQEMQNWIFLQCLTTCYDKFLLSIRNCWRISCRFIVQLYISIELRFNCHRQKNDSRIKNHLFFTHEKVWIKTTECCSKKFWDIQAPFNFFI